MFRSCDLSYNILYKLINMWIVDLSLMNLLGNWRSCEGNTTGSCVLL